MTLGWWQPQAGVRPLNPPPLGGAAAGFAYGLPSIAAQRPPLATPLPPGFVDASATLNPPAFVRPIGLGQWLTPSGASARTVEIEDRRTYDAVLSFLDQIKQAAARQDFGDGMRVLVATLMAEVQGYHSTAARQSGNTAATLRWDVYVEQAKTRARDPSWVADAWRTADLAKIAHQRKIGPLVGDAAGAAQAETRRSSLTQEWTAQLERPAESYRTGWLPDIEQYAKYGLYALGALFALNVVQALRGSTP